MAEDRELRSGTVTLLSRTSRAFTGLAERLDDRWPVLLGEHNRILRETGAVVIAAAPF